MFQSTGLVSRRTVLKGTASVGVAIAAPAIIKGALASSGELKFMGWAGYPELEKSVFPAFEKATGIKVKLTEEPGQDDMLAQAKLAVENGAFDVAEPTVERTRAWVTNGLVQPWDMSKISLDAYIPGIADGSAGAAATVDGKRYHVPSVWGTEALVYSIKEKPETYGTASLGDLWDDSMVAKVTVRAHSSLAAMGRWLDSQGKLPKPWLDGYKDEATMKQLWDIALAECVKHKKNIVQFWTGENEAQAAFRSNGATLGLCWDSTGGNMAKEGFGYIAPKEGAFAWNQGFVLLKGAKNVDQAHEFAKWVGTAEGSALWATAFGANPVGKGGIDKTSDEVKKFYAASFPGDALSKLWWWPVQEAWFLKLRGEYSDKWKAA
jgi:spermidine/putrescine transport system substrate-binding protein